MFYTRSNVILVFYAKSNTILVFYTKSNTILVFYAKVNAILMFYTKVRITLVSIQSSRLYRNYMTLLVNTNSFYLNLHEIREKEANGKYICRKGPLNYEFINYLIEKF